MNFINNVFSFICNKLPDTKAESNKTRAKISIFIVAVDVVVVNVLVVAVVYADVVC